MNNKTLFSKDLFPSLEELMYKEKKTRVTIELSNKSIDFFKKVAKKGKVSYQVMIRRLLDLYIDKYQKIYNPSKFASA